MKARWCALTLAIVIAFAAGLHGQQFLDAFVRRVYFTALGGAFLSSGTGSPESAVAAPIGSLFFRTDGSAGTSLYVKESGSSNTGWQAVAGGSVTASSTTTFTNKTLNAESTGNVVTTVEKLYVPAALCYDSGGTPDTYVRFWHLLAAGSPSAECISGTNVITAVLNYGDGGAAVAHNSFQLPADWTGTVDLLVVWGTPATSNNVRFTIETACVAVGESVDPSWNTAQGFTDAAQGSTERLNTAAQTSVTTTGCAAGEHFFYRLGRDPSNGSDTLANTARVYGIEWTYRRAQ